MRHRRGLFVLTTPDRCAPEDGCPLAKNVVWRESLLPDVALGSAAGRGKVAEPPTSAPSKVVRQTTGRAERGRITGSGIPSDNRRGVAAGDEHNCLIDSFAQLVHPGWGPRRRK